MKYILEHIGAELGDSEETIRKKIATATGLPLRSFRFQILGKSLYLKQDKPTLDLRVAFETNEFVRDTSLHFYEERLVERTNWSSSFSPVVVGGGIAGFFAAYELALAGAKPILLEKGKPWKERSRVLGQAYEKANGPIEEWLSGEGGYFAALGGMGKRCFSPVENEVFRILDLLALPYPKQNTSLMFSAHILDILLEKMHQEIEHRGGTILCDSEVVAIKTFFGRPKSISYRRNGALNTIKTQAIVLATGSITEKDKSFFDKASLLTEKGSKNLYFALQHRREDVESNLLKGHRRESLPPIDLSYGDLQLIPFSGRLIQTSLEKAMDFALSIDEKPGKSLFSFFKLPSSALTNAQAKQFAGSVFDLNAPFSAPVELVSDFIMKREPLRLGKVVPETNVGAHLADFHKKMNPSACLSTHSLLSKIGGQYPFLLGAGTILLGVSWFNQADYFPKTDRQGRTNIASIYSACPTQNGLPDVLEAARNGINAALSLLNDA